MIDKDRIDWISMKKSYVQIIDYESRWESIRNFVHSCCSCSGMLQVCGIRTTRIESLLSPCTFSMHVCSDRTFRSFHPLSCSFYSSLLLPLPNVWNFSFASCSKVLNEHLYRNFFRKYIMLLYIPLHLIERND